MELEQRLTTLTAKAKEAEDAKGMISRNSPRVVMFRMHEMNDLNRGHALFNRIFFSFEFEWTHRKVLFLEFL